MSIRHFDALPKPYKAYGKVILSLIKKPKVKTKTLPQAEYIVDRLNIDEKHLKAYNDICTFKNDGTVPAMYLAVLAQSLQMSMMTEEPFPFALLGMVHIRNVVRQTRKIEANEVLTLSCKFGELRPHDKGQQFDFITAASVNGEQVYSGVTTYLVRQKVEAAAKSDKPKDNCKPGYNNTQDWSIPENIGRRYAAISGDVNLIHIHEYTAKAFGFKRAIAHGMWTKARSLAALGDLPDAYEADVQFKLPVFIPTKVTLQSVKDSNILFELCDTKTGKPHLSGQVTSL
ncbi:MaoC family dehydratase [Alkanindiges illinoisensis]|uniref:MaoC family dehydratase n=1 Tax=Alkanindiges illinoisensis TaxID=197183 RepID=UPI00047DDF64|nr:MaoC/PaaZ C-terminal domain-containing protein [Alkanindiges illinoisensis]